jgi:hypothetical protein
MSCAGGVQLSLQGPLPVAHCRWVGLQLLQHAQGLWLVCSGWLAKAAERLS